MSKRPPKRVTAARLRNIAIAYIRRYGGSASRVRAMLARRVERSLSFHQEQARASECAAMVLALMVELRAEGLLDEARQARAEALRQALGGRPQRVISQALRAKGFEPAAVEAAVSSLKGDAAGGPEADWVACCRYARRRRLGPFQVPGRRGERSRESQLRALLRAGFGYRLAVRVLDATDVAELEAVLEQVPVPILYR